MFFASLKMKLSLPDYSVTPNFADRRNFTIRRITSLSKITSLAVGKLHSKRRLAKEQAAFLLLFVVAVLLLACKGKVVHESVKEIRDKNYNADNDEDAKHTLPHILKGVYES